MGRTRRDRTLGERTKQVKRFITRSVTGSSLWHFFDCKREVALGMI